MVTCVKQPPNEDRPLPIIADNQDTTFPAREMLEQAYNLGVAIHVFPPHTTSITQPLDARDSTCDIPRAPTVISRLGADSNPFHWHPSRQLVEL
jgi:hypothetical protein